MVSYKSRQNNIEVFVLLKNNFKKVVDFQLES